MAFIDSSHVYDPRTDLQLAMTGWSDRALAFYLKQARAKATSVLMQLVDADVCKIGRTQWKARRQLWSRKMYAGATDIVHLAVCPRSLGDALERALIQHFTSWSYWRGVFANKQLGGGRVGEDQYQLVYLVLKTSSRPQY